MSATAFRTQPARGSGWTARREQIALASAQLLAGAGNLAFVLACAHLLAPRAYSRLAAFMAAYLLLYMPFSALAASAALSPESVPRTRLRVVAIGAGVGVLLAAGALGGLAPALGMEPGLLLALAVSAPLSGLVALERGRALGEQRRLPAVGSLLAEPALRLAAGIPAAAAFGGIGAAAAVVLGGCGAVLVASSGRSASRGAQHDWSARAGGAGIGLAFLLLAVIQNQDVLWSNAKLGTQQAAQFAVLSTLGGIAVFATTTVPLVLLARARQPRRGDVGVAVATAVVLGLTALIPGIFDAHALISGLFGVRYAAVGGLLWRYLLAMALLGVARVLVAHRCSTPGRARVVIALLAACAGLQALLIGLAGDSAAGVAQATLVACATLTAGVALLALVSVRAPASPTALAATVAPELPAPVAQPSAGPPPLRLDGSVLPRSRRGLEWTLLAVGALTVLGAVVRLGAGRSLWLDEATSVAQAKMPFGAMLTSLRTIDVQPPLHDALLWLLTHAFGDSAAIVRAPSLLAGTLLIPLLYALGRDLWDRRTGLISAALASGAPFLIWYSQEARMYALFMLWAALALWAQVRILTGTRRRPVGWWALYTAATVALVWTQYFSLLLIGVQQGAFAVAVLRRPSGERAPLAIAWVVSGIVIAACLAPLAGFAYEQYQANQASGRGFGATPSQTGSGIEAGHLTPTIYTVLTNIVWAIWGYHSAGTMAAIAALWPLVMLFVLALLGRGRSWRVALLLSLAAVPIAAMFVIGQLKPFLFEVRYFSGAAPVAILLLARVCARWAGRGTAAAAAATAILFVSFAVAFADQQYSVTNPRVYDFQDALGRIDGRVRPGDVLLYQPLDLRDIVSYYAPHVTSAPLGARPAARAPGHNLFLLASFQSDLANSRAVRAALAQLRKQRRQILSFRLPGVEVWEFR
ncbi:MAG: glycosyltransferase family 39 protein [Solirubrobacteraceae bacterium]